MDVHLVSQGGLKMSKLQEIIRVNGSVVNSVNIPKEELEKLEWKKGDNLLVIADSENKHESPNFIKITKENLD